jgi:hypothetical protein
MRFKNLCTILLIAGIFALGISPQPSYATDASVTSCGGGTGAGTIRAAVTAANSGGGIITYTLSCTTTISSQMSITNNVTINANGFAVTINGGGFNRHIRVTSSGSLTVNGITFNSGRSLDGGSIQNLGTLVVNNSTFTNNLAALTNGGAISNFGTATINNSTFTGNRSLIGSGGAVANVVGSTTISASTFSDNEALISGGAVANVAGSTSISASTFSDNDADASGGAFANIAGTSSIITSTFMNNDSALGGAVTHVFGDLSIDTSAFIGNTAEFGGGVFNTPSAMSISNSTFSGNSASINGGGVNNTGELTLTHVTFHNNTASVGGNIRVASNTVTLIASIIHEGDCDVAGTLVDGGNNIIHNANNCVGTAIDPTLGALTGGVHIPASTAIEYAVACASGQDQLGNTRPMGTACTPGAVEIDDDAITVIPVDAVAAVVPVVVGCVFDAPSGMEIGNAPDNTYCRVLMRDGGVTSYSGAVPADLIGLGVILAVDVYRLEGGATQNTFPDYAQICLSGTGRFFYMDGRNMPRHSVEMPSSAVNGMTCAWIPAPGTVILTN